MLYQVVEIEAGRYFGGGDWVSQWAVVTGRGSVVRVWWEFELAIDAAAQLTALWEGGE